MLQTNIQTHRKKNKKWASRLLSPKPSSPHKDSKSKRSDISEYYTVFPIILFLVIDKPTKTNHINAAVNNFTNTNMKLLQHEVTGLTKNIRVMKSQTNLKLMMRTTPNRYLNKTGAHAYQSDKSNGRN